MLRLHVLIVSERRTSFISTLIVALNNKAHQSLYGTRVMSSCLKAEVSSEPVEMDLDAPTQPLPSFQEAAEPRIKAAARKRDRISPAKAPSSSGARAGAFLLALLSEF